MTTPYQFHGEAPGTYLNRKAFDPAVKQLDQALRVLDVRLPKIQLEAVARRAIRAYVDTLPSVPRNNHRIAQGTKQIMALEVGDTLICDPIHHAVLRSRMSTVRNLTGNKGLRFTCLDRQDERGKWRTLVTRLPDNSPYVRDPRNNKRALVLSEIPVGGYVIKPWGSNYIGNSTKNQARRILGDQGANWTTKTINQGLKITRTS